MFDMVKNSMRRIIREEITTCISESDLDDKLSNVTALIEQYISKNQGVAGQLACNTEEQLSNVAAIALSEDCCSRYIPPAVVNQCRDPESNQMRETIQRILAMNQDDAAQAIMKEMEENSFPKLVDEFILMKGESRDRYLETLHTLRLCIMKRYGLEQKSLLAKLFDAVTLDEFDRPQFQDVSLMRLPIFQASTLSSNLVRRRRMRQLTIVPEAYLTYNKKFGERFARMANIPCPKSQYDLHLDEIVPIPGMVIKPMDSASSRGVYLVRDVDKIWDVQNFAPIGSWNDVVLALRKSLEMGSIRQDSFLVQQYISKLPPPEYIPANDYKFYTFYGEIGAILEISRYPKKEYWWWTPKGTQIKGKMPIYPLDNSMGPPNEQQLALAREVSLMIPCPHLRIDFLVGHDQMYLDEFCTFSGGGNSGGKNSGMLLEQRMPSYNKQFGKMYLQAESRITEDLLNGKRFETLMEFNRICKEELKNE